MVRPRTPIGTYGTIAVRRQTSGRYAARMRYRDWDGKSRHVQATATTQQYRMEPKPNIRWRSISIFSGAQESKYSVGTPPYQRHHHRNLTRAVESLSSAGVLFALAGGKTPIDHQL